MGLQSFGVYLRCLSSSACPVLHLWREDKSKKQVGTNSMIIDLVMFILGIRVPRVSMFNFRCLSLEGFQPSTC